jgi:acyl dehydratase
VKTDPRVEEWVGKTLDAGEGEIMVEEGYIRPWLEATENPNPIYWDPKIADEVTGGPIAPPSMLSVWMRPLLYKPGRTEPRRPLELHFRLKEAFDLPEGVVAENEMTFHAPLRPGDRVSVTESVREISEERETKLGTGRKWIIDVTYTNQKGELVGVETYRMFGYRR